MLCNVISLLFLLLTVSADSLNSFARRLSTDKPDILLQDPLISKSVNSPTHISEFTDPDTGLNPFLDLEEGPTLMGRDVMKDETREHSKENHHSFMDFEMVEGDSSDRRWNIELGFPKKPLEESIPMWIPIEEDFEEITLEENTTTFQSSVTDADDTIPTFTKDSDEEQLLDNEASIDMKPKIGTDTAFSKIMILYVLVSIGILLFIIFLLLGSWYWKRRLRRTSQLPTAVENGELKS